MRRAYRIGERPRKKITVNMLMGTYKQEQEEKSHICSFELVRNRRTKERILGENPNFNSHTPVWICECKKVTQSM